LTLGAGKIIYQHFPRIMLAIRDGSFYENPTLKKAFEHARSNNSAVNLVGLLSKGNTHAALDHLHALIEMAKREKVERVNLHLFGDGKDCPPKTAGEMLATLPREMLATFTGRYYAMDREGNWQLTKNAYDTLVGGGAQKADDVEAVLRTTYQRGLSEEYVPPTAFSEGKAVQDNDAVIFFNYREDSIRQVSEAFIDPVFSKFSVKKFQNLYITTFTRYEERFTVPVAFAPDTVEHPLGQVISDAGKTQLRLAETYKYAHVTYFFNGYKEEPFKSEYRVLIPSLQTPAPAEHPEMMAVSITDRLIQGIENQGFDFMLVNYANADTMGHTGNYDAAVATVKIIDRELGRIMKVASRTPTMVAITSDHGNVERVFDPATGRPETQHDANPVPFYLVAPEFKNKKFLNWKNLRFETAGGLQDIAPTVLELMGLPQPLDMNGHSLLRNLL
jgi:2,3-bisphosphoglycerate-independent phosphoglycerate mutase